mmetsp:Transcript_22230/g.34518  ORF Transcript_22230/g.34518 Transcript_22230/m.34518 type:complete len:82 (+) Transcript_22230:209-454(+)
MMPISTLANLHFITISPTTIKDLGRIMQAKFANNPDFSRVGKNHSSQFIIIICLLIVLTFVGHNHSLMLFMIKKSDKLQMK